jgi:hypothetical protein
VRPRFVVVLAVAAVLAGLTALADFPSALGADVYRRGLLGTVIEGTAARAVTLLEPVAYLATAVGLWRLRPWARHAAMAYLALVVVAFLFVGVAAGEDKRATAVLLWQVSVVPFATFCFMFLYNGRRYFSSGSEDATS